MEFYCGGNILSIVIRPHFVVGHVGRLVNCHNDDQWALQREIVESFFTAHIIDLVH